MKRFYCNGKKGYCDRGNDANVECFNCEFGNGEGGKEVEVPVVKRFTFPRCRVPLCDNGNFKTCDLPTESFLAKKRYMFPFKSPSETVEEKAFEMAKEDFAYWDEIENELISKREQGTGYRQTPDVEFYVDLLDIDII